MAIIRARNVWRNRLAFAAFWAWLAAWFTPALAGSKGWQLVIFAVLEGWHEPQLGAWAVLANLTIPAALGQVLTGRRPTGLLLWSVALPVTSPGYWLLLQQFSADGVGVILWTTAILLLVGGGMLTAPLPAGRDPLPLARPRC